MSTEEWTASSEPRALTSANAAQFSADEVREALDQLLAGEDDHDPTAPRVSIEPYLEPLLLCAAEPQRRISAVPAIAIPARIEACERESPAPSAPAPSIAPRARPWKRRGVAAFACVASMLAGAALAMRTQAPMSRPAASQIATTLRYAVVVPVRRAAAVDTRSAVEATTQPETTVPAIALAPRATDQRNTTPTSDVAIGVSTDDRARAEGSSRHQANRHEPGAPLLIAAIATTSPAVEGVRASAATSAALSNADSTGTPSTSPPTAAAATATAESTPTPPAATPEAAAPATPDRSACSTRCAGDLTCMAACAVDTERPRAAEPRPSETLAAPAPAAPALPDLPERASVAHAIESVADAVRGCGDGATANAIVTITFSHTGHVTIATTGAPYAGTPAGSCIARAVRVAEVPPFGRDHFSVQAPFSMR